jgi:hypothetical protein
MRYTFNQVWCYYLIQFKPGGRWYERPPSAMPDLLDWYPDAQDVSDPDYIDGRPLPDIATSDFHRATDAYGRRLA